MRSYGEGGRALHRLPLVAADPQPAAAMARGGRVHQQRQRDGGRSARISEREIGIEWPAVSSV
jgi:hypothetical protein